MIWWILVFLINTWYYRWRLWHYPEDSYLYCAPTSYNTHQYRPPTRSNVNGQVYTNSGVYSQLFTNASGCDSVLQFRKRSTGASSGTFSASACSAMSGKEGQAQHRAITYKRLPMPRAVIV